MVLAEVTGVDLNSRTVDANCPGLGIRKILFDYLVVATGMRPSYFGHDEFARYAPGLKNLNDAEMIRTKSSAHSSLPKRPTMWANVTGK